jgi:2-dehydropantoate 2-reductase
VRILIAGAGAIGGYIGARLAGAGADVTLFARGAQLQAMRDRGLRVLSAEGDVVVQPRVTGDLESVGQTDVIVLGVKAHGLTDLAPRLRPLFTDETVVVSTQNGIPWWYFDRQGGDPSTTLRVVPSTVEVRLEGWRLESVDPGGIIAGAIESRRVLGSLAYFATEIVEPGVIRHVEGNRISLGEPEGVRSDRSRAIAEALIAAGFRCPITTRIRSEIWVKLLGNVAFNPISALTRATLAAMARHPQVSRLARDVMAEATEVASKLGIELPISIDQRMAGAEKVGEHRTSMLQDLESGRRMELDAIVGAVIEIGERLGVPTPSMRAVYACASLLDDTIHHPRQQPVASVAESLP